MTSKFPAERRNFVVALGLGGLLALTGCGGDDDGNATPSYAVAAAARNVLSTQRAVTAIGQRNPFTYTLISRPPAQGQATYVTTLQVSGSNLYANRTFSFDQNLNMLTTERDYGAFVPGPSPVDARNTVTTSNPLPASARIGDSGIWFVTQNYARYTDVASRGPSTGTSTVTYSLQADVGSTALLKLREALVDTVKGVTTSTEIVLRITNAGDVSLVSDNNTSNPLGEALTFP